MRHPMRRLLLASALLGLSCATDAIAGVVIYRCTDAFGRLTVQNDRPCPKGTRQRKQIVDTPAPMPAYQPPPVRPVPSIEPIPEIATQAPATPLPPPPLFRCRTPGGDSYLGEDGDPAPRCIALPVVGLDGAPSTAGAACQMQTDTCDRVPDAAACEAWQQYAREAEAAWRFGRSESATEHQGEFERIQRVLRESTCAHGKPAG